MNTQMLKRAELAGLARRLIADGEARPLRERQRITLAEVGAIIGRSEAAVSRYETGERFPTGEAAVDYGRLLQRWLAAEEVTP